MSTTIERITYRNVNWMYANGLRALQRPDGLWHVQVNSSLTTISRAATTEEAEAILSAG